MTTNTKEIRTPLKWQRWRTHESASRIPAVVELVRVQADPNSNEFGYGKAPLRGLLGERDNLADKCLIYMGLGAVGGPSFLDAARLGVGTLIGVDLDRYGEDSWRTQPATAGDAGRAKAEMLGEQAHAINAAIDVRTAMGFAQDLPLRILRRADVFVVAGDNLELLVWAGNMAAALKKPLLQGAVHGESWTAFVRSFDLRDPWNPCPACNLNAREWRQLSSRYGCDPATMRAQGKEPTRTLPNLCGVAGHMLTGEVLKLLSGMDAQALRNAELAYCLLSHRVWKSELTWNPGCRCPHEAWRLEDAPTPEQVSLEALARRMGEKLTAVAVRGEKPWVQLAACSQCGAEKAAQRFARIGDAIGACKCGGELTASPMGMSSQMPAGDVASSARLPLAELGLEAGDCVGLRTGDSWTYFQLGDVTEELRP